MTPVLVDRIIRWIDDTYSDGGPALAWGNLGQESRHRAGNSRLSKMDVG